MEKLHKSKANWKSWAVAGGLVLIAAAVVLVLLWPSLFQPKEISAGNNAPFDSAALMLPESDESKQTPPDYEIAYSINAAPVFHTADMSGDLFFVNPPENVCLLTVTLLTDGGEILYKSRFLKPGQYLKSVQLQKELSPGSYQITARFSAYSPENLAYFGYLDTGISLTVLA